MALAANVLYEEELKKNPEMKESDVQSLRSWCAEQPHLPKISDFELALFLHSNYYRIEPTKATIDTFYTVRTHSPEYFGNRDPLGKELQQALTIMSLLTLHQTTREGYKVIFITLIDNDASKYIYNDHIKLLAMLTDLWLYCEGTTKGHIILCDTANVTFKHMVRVNLMGFKKFLHYLQEGLPVRLKGIHFMNTKLVMNVFFNMMKPLLKKELMEMIHLHSTANTLDSFIPLEILPNELGGKAGQLTELHLEQVKRLEEHRDWFLEEERRARVDETKRPGNSNTATDNHSIA